MPRPLIAACLALALLPLAACNAAPGRGGGGVDIASCGGGLSRSAATALAIHNASQDSPGDRLRHRC